MIKKLSFYCLITIFCFLFCLSIIPSGRNYQFGLGFWNAHGHDAIWHLAIINQALTSIPPKNPVFSNTLLSNYHWGFDYLIALANRVTNISVLKLYFLIFPIFITISLAFLSFKLKENKKINGLLFLFLNFFSGSLGYIVTLIKSGDIGGESLFWSMQPISTLINPPFALSLVVFFYAIYLSSLNLKKPTILKSILVGFLFGLNTFIKIYISILTGLGLSIIIFFRLLTKQKIDKYLLITFFTAALTSLFFLILLGIKSTSSLIFKPFWFTNSLIDAYDKLYLPSISTLRFNLENQFSLIKLPILITIYFFSLLIFTFGNLGTRIFGFSTIFSRFKNKKNTLIDQLFLIILFLSFCFPLFFVQKGTPWNTIQFFYYFIFISNYYFADFLVKLFTNNKVFFYILIIFTIPTTISTIKSFIGFPPPACLPSQELAALNFLKDQPSGIVLTKSYDKPNKSITTPIPLFLYESTAYVSAFSKKIAFIEDYVNLEITGYDWKSRKQLVDNFFNNQPEAQLTGFLLNNNIDYIYLTFGQYLPENLPLHQVTNIYNQNDIKIYKVLK